MTFSPRSSVLLRLVFVCVFIGTSLAVVQAQVEWRPVPPHELAMTEPTVEKDADAEAIFWETRLDDKKSSQLAISHYVRVKIFNERGRERFSKLDIPFAKGKKVEDIAARVIRSDGSITELAVKDIFEREIAKVGKIKVMAKSFAVPMIEPGVIVEYQYTEKIKGDSVSGEKLIFQRDIPMQKVVYMIRPYQNQAVTFNWYNIPDGGFVKGPDGYLISTMFNVPAYKDEPYMPPDDEVRRWAYASYGGRGGNWFQLQLTWNLIMARMAKPTKAVKAKASELTGSIASNNDKLERIYNFVQKEIRNVTYDRALSEDQADKFKVKDADDVLKNKAGNSIFINLLFASLANAAGFDSGIVLSGDRSEAFFSPEKYPFTSFLEPAAVYVRLGSEVKYFNPGVPYLGFGQVSWTREGTRSMMVSESTSSWRLISVAEPKHSPARRKGNFRLEEDGTLSGTATIEYSGHQAIARRRDDYRSSEAKREESFKDELKGRISTAEVTDLSIRNFDDPSKPLIYSYKVKIPNYAQKVGRRLIIRPGTFEFGSPPVFASDTRAYDVYFPYAWSEQDELEIMLPAGFSLENAESPADVADPNGISSQKISMAIDKGSNKLIYKREFFFGGNAKLIFPATAYSALKRLFDAFHQMNDHSISLRAEQ